MEEQCFYYARPAFPWFIFDFPVCAEFEAPRVLGQGPACISTISRHVRSIFLPGLISSAHFSSLERARPPGRETNQRRPGRGERAAIPRTARVFSWLCPYFFHPDFRSVSNSPALHVSIWKGPHLYLPSFSYDGTPFSMSFRTQGDTALVLEAPPFTPLGEEERLALQFLVDLSIPLLAHQTPPRDSRELQACEEH